VEKKPTYVVVVELAAALVPPILVIVFWKAMKQPTLKRKTVVARTPIAENACVLAKALTVAYKRRKLSNLPKISVTLMAVPNVWVNLRAQVKIHNVVQSLLKIKQQHRQDIV